MVNIRLEESMKFDRFHGKMQRPRRAIEKAPARERRGSWFLKCGNPLGLFNQRADHNRSGRACRQLGVRQCNLAIRRAIAIAVRRIGRK